MGEGMGGACLIEICCVIYNIDERLLTLNNLLLNLWIYLLLYVNLVHTSKTKNLTVVMTIIIIDKLYLENNTFSTFYWRTLDETMG